MNNIHTKNHHNNFLYNPSRAVKSQVNEIADRLD